MHTLMKDLTVELGPDRPGTLGKAFDAIAKAGVNIEGFAEIGGSLHVLTRDAPTTKRALESAGFQVSRDDEVVVVDVMDRPGVAANMFRQLGDANVNVSFAYLATNTRVAVATGNTSKATEILSRVGAAIA